MRPASELLLPEEDLIGEYNVEIARWSNGRWTPTVPMLYAILTEYRLILQPQSRKRREPAIIPAKYIVHVAPFNQQMYSGILLSLTTGHRIALLVSSTQQQTILRNLRTVALPNWRRKQKTNVELDLGSLKRLIDHLSNL